MPAKSGKQYRFMQMIAHGKKSNLKGLGGPSKEVAREFIHKTPPKKRKTFAQALRRK